MFNPSYSIVLIQLDLSAILLFCILYVSCLFCSKHSILFIYFCYNFTSLFAYGYAGFSLLLPSFLSLTAVLGLFVAVAFLTVEHRL